MPSPAYSRLEVDERRRQLLAIGAELFTEHAYDEISMNGIAARAGISKGLLYHYFPSKRDFFVATMQSAAAELRARTEPDPARGDAFAQLRGSIEAYLRFIEENAGPYSKLMQSVGIPEVRSLVDAVRTDTRDRVLGALSPDAPPAPALRAAVTGWLWGMDGVCLDWLEHGDLRRAQVLELLVGTLVGALGAVAQAAAPDPAAG